MSEFDKVDEVPRRVMVLFFVIDTSGSMEGRKIQSVNASVGEALKAVKEISASNPDAKVKIAAMEFSSGIEWMTPQPVDVENFEWIDLEAGGLTCLGEACTELCGKLSTKGYMTQATGSYAPAIILMSDGVPTDDYKHSLEKLKGNNWFRAAIKVAIAIGDDPNKDVLAEFTGNSEAVITVHTQDQLKKIIHFVTVTASQVASKSSSVGKDAAETKQQENIDKIKAEVESNPDLSGIDIGTDAPALGDSDWNDW